MMMGSLPFRSPIASRWTMITEFHWTHDVWVFDEAHCEDKISVLFGGIDSPERPCFLLKTERSSSVLRHKQPKNLPYLLTRGTLLW